MATPDAPPPATPDPAQDEIRVGISACLLGERVRFDGGHKRDGYLTQTLAQFVRFVPVCPEVDLGLGTPRESLRLVRDGDRVRILAPRSGVDHTAEMDRYARGKARELGNLDLCGFIFKKDSPSCGLHRVRVYDHNGVPTRSGRGLFAAALIARHSLLPVEDEGRLRDPRLRENFFERVFAYRRLKDLFGSRWRLRDLIEFHAREKLLLMAHDVAAYRELGRLVASAKGRPSAELVAEYERRFMEGLAKIATARKHANVLQHILGYFRKLLPPDERREIVDIIEDFRAGLVPLVVPVTLLQHHIRRSGIDYLAAQSYLNPHPKELVLRNHV